MSHRTDLAEALDAAEAAYALGDREAGYRLVSLANRMERDCARLATRVAEEMERADIRTVYDNDPHRGQP